MCIPRDSIRNAALDRKLQLATIFGNVESVWTFNRNIQSTNCILPGSTNSPPSQPVPTTLQNKLKIYQWNTDGILPKFIELRDRFLNSDINALADQELKLQKTDKTPSIKGYTRTWKDRNNNLEGDLLLFIRVDIVFEKLHSVKKAGMEILSIGIKATKLS